MAYQMNVDYKSLIDKEMAKGLNKDQSQINRLQQARAEKMAANPDKLNQWGITPQKELTAGNQLQNLGLRDYMNQGGITGDKKYELGNIGSTPTINGIAVDPSVYGMQLVNDRWVGTKDQLNNLLQPFNEQMSAQAVPEATAANKYSQILDSQLQNFLQGDYDPANDPVYQNYMGAATKQIQDQVIKEMNRRGIMSSSLTGDKIANLVAQQGALVMPEFADRYRQNLMDKYGVARELEESQYGRGQDEFMNRLAREGFDLEKEQTYWERDFANNQFDWNKTMDQVGVTQEGLRYGFEMAKFEYDKYANEPVRQAQVIQNKMSLIDLNNLSSEWEKKLAQMDADLNATNVSVEERKKNIEIANAELDKILNEQIYDETTYDLKYAKNIMDKSGIIKKGTSTIDDKKLIDFYNELERLQDIGVSDNVLFQLANSYTNVDLNKVYKMFGGD